MPPYLTQKQSTIDSHLQMRNQFSPRESRWGNKPLLRESRVSSSRWPTQMNSKASLKLLHLLMLSPGKFVCFLPYRSSCIKDSGFEFSWISWVYKHCVSGPTYNSCAFLCLYFLFDCFVIFQFVCFWFILFLFYYHSSDAYLFSKERKGTDADGREDGEELGGIEGRETVIRIYCLEKICFQWKKRKIF